MVLEMLISDYTNILDKLEHPTGGTAPEETVKSMLTALNKDYGDLQELFKAMIEEYNKTYVKDVAIEQNGVRYSKSSIFSGSFVVRTIKNAAPIMLAVMLGIAIYFLVRTVRKEKKVN